MSSCCGGKCGCGGSCSCGSGCSGCAMYPDIEGTTVAAIIGGVASSMKMSFEVSEKSFGAEGGCACKCGPNCKCNPCNC